MNPISPSQTRCVRRWLRGLGFGCILWLVLTCQAMTVRDLPPQGPQPTVVDEQGRSTPLYSESHALLISASAYLGTKNGWPRLEETSREMDQVAAELQLHGFHVRRVSDPNGEELQNVFRNFLAQYGHKADNRLLLFFSGHGYTNPANGVGYLVPVDALNPDWSYQDFYTKALEIETLQVLAKSISARHAIFLFDSCFSGSIFTSKSEANRPEPRGSTTWERWNYLTRNAAKPVRQFIAAGGPDELLPAKSIFVPLLLKGLQGRGSAWNDGYVTGKELGQWITQTLPSYVGKKENPQNPHSDVIRVPDLAFGDIVFQVPSMVPKSETRLPPQPDMPAQRSSSTQAAQPVHDAENDQASELLSKAITEFTNKIVAQTKTNDVDSNVTSSVTLSGEGAVSIANNNKFEIKNGVLLWNNNVVANFKYFPNRSFFIVTLKNGDISITSGNETILLSNKSNIK